MNTAKSMALQVAEYFSECSNPNIPQRVKVNVQKNQDAIIRAYTFYWEDSNGQVQNLVVLNDNLYPNFLNKTIDMFPGCESPVQVAKEALEIFECFVIWGRKVDV